MRDEPIKVFIADDHDVVVRGIKDILSEGTGIEVVGTTGSGSGLLEQLLALKPQIVFLDIMMPDSECAETLQKIYMLSCPPSVIIVSAKLDYQIASIAYELGASYLLKEDALSISLLKTISVVSRGEPVYSQNVQAMFQRAHKTKYDAGLKPDQYVVLQLMADGCDSCEIASKIGKSVQAVYSIQQRIRRKMGVSSSDQAVVKAIREHLVSLGSEY